MPDMSTFCPKKTQKIGTFGRLVRIWFEFGSPKYLVFYAFRRKNELRQAPICKAVILFDEQRTANRYQFKTTLKYKNVNYDVQLCYLIATAPDAPSENVKRQIAQGQSEELKFSSSDSESLKKQGSF